MHREHVELDLAKRLHVDRIYLRVGEGGMTTIDATIKNDGEPYDLTGKSVLFLAYDKDKKNIYEQARITDGKAGKVSYTVSSRLTNMKGEIRIAYFRIQNGTDQITTQDIPIEVLENVDLDGEQAEEYTSQFEQLLAEIQAMMADVNEALLDTNAAAKKATDAAAEATAANSSFSKAEAGRVSAEGSRSLAETARDRAEAERLTSEAQRVADETNRQKAEEAREAAESQRSEEWEQIKADAETATQDATEAAQAANDAADRIGDVMERATAASDRAEVAAGKTEQVIKDATDAAGKAEIAASVSNAATARLNDAMRDFNAVLGTEISYAIGTSSTVPPTSGWTAAQQAVPQGQFSWERTITHFWDGTSTVAYAVAYQGKDGRDGVTTQINGLYWFDVEEDNLVVYYHDQDDPPEFEIEEGILYALYETD